LIELLEVIGRRPGRGVRRGGNRQDPVLHG
jgi:hypothetical protein